MSITPYLDLITSQHSSQPAFMAWLTAALQKVDDGMAMTSGMPDAFSVATAVGPQLDLLGQQVGANRNVGITLSTGTSILDDDHFRLLIQAKIAANSWDGTIPGLYSLWASVFPNSSIRITDNQNMTMSLNISGITDAVSEEMINDGFIIPKPMGVSISSITFATLLTWDDLQNNNVTYNMVDGRTYDQLEMTTFG